MLNLMQTLEQHNKNIMYSISKSVTVLFDMLQPQSPRKKKKKKVDVEAAVGNLDLIAMGTTSGTVLLYSFARGQVHTHLVCICCVPFVVGNVIVVALIS